MIPCVGAVVHDEDGRLLLVLRGNEPARGTWSLPGGRVGPGEDAVAAVVREVLEETGFEVAVLHPVGTVMLPAPDGDQYLVVDWACRTTGGLARAGDDADDVRWFSARDVADLPPEAFSPGLLDSLAGWDMLPR